jgi:hypothetical protein
VCNENLRPIFLDVLKVIDRKQFSPDTVVNPDPTDSRTKYDYTKIDKEKDKGTRQKMLTAQRAKKRAMTFNNLSVALNE